MELRWSSRQTVERWRPMERAISDWLQPCLLSAASIYLSPEVSWWYVMANILFVVVENLRQYRRSPPSGGSVLHLVYESAKIPARRKRNRRLLPGEERALFSVGLVGRRDHLRPIAEVA